MTTTKATFIRNLGIGALISLAAIAYLSLPAFEANRTYLIEMVGLSPTGLTLSVGILVLLVFVLLATNLNHSVSEPLNRLLKQAETNHLNSAYSPKSKLMEIGRLRYLLENRAMVTTEMEEQIEELESKIVSLEDEAKSALRDSDLHRKEIREKTDQLEELRFERMRLQEACDRLEKSLNNERSSNVGEEVEKRTDEIYSQMEKAVEASAYKTLWLPRTLQNLKTPATLVHETATRLANGWESSSFARLRDDIDLISRQSGIQIKLLSQLEGQGQSATNDENEDAESSNDPSQEETSSPVNEYASH